MERSKSTRKGSGLRNLVKACWSPPISDCECYGDKEEVRMMQQYQQQQLLQQQQYLMNNSSKCLMSYLPDDLLVECLARIPRESLPNSLLVCRKWRSILKSDEYYHIRAKVGTMEKLVVVFGGCPGAGISCATYSQSSRKWIIPGLFSSSSSSSSSNSSSSSSSFFSHPHCDLEQAAAPEHTLIHAQAAVVNHRIFVLGGAVDCCVVYDTWTGAVTRAAPMLRPRKKFACGVISNRIFVAGGTSRGQVGMGIWDAEEYLPELNLWRPIPNMPRRRYGCIGAAVDGLFYVIGGIKRPYAYVGSMDCFDPVAKIWLKSKPLPTGCCVIACAVVGWCIYMLSSHAVELSFWRYDTRSQDWSKINLPPVPSPLRIDNLLKFSCVTVGSSVYIIQVGGSVDDLLRRNGRHPRGLRDGLVLSYDTQLREWHRAPGLPAAVRTGAICAVVEC